MTLVPEQGSGRLTALLLLVIVLILVYLVCFHWFFMRHFEYSEEIAGLSEQLGRFEQIASRRADYEARLRELQSRRADASLFLEGDDFNEAAAGMSEQLNRMIRTQTEDTCQIVSRQPVRPRVEERFQRVTVNARMRCGIEDLTKIVYSLETGVPMILTEELTVIKPRTRRRRSDDTPENVLLDIRFNMSGYLREAP
ncbi:MAG: type II secretion system protein GspM [Xanthomonadales bacterium]|jgi:general secretion pathway protein M|nr:type II secretion system protein GspM [Xanthomonadales bacterium]